MRGCFSVSHLWGGRTLYLRMPAVLPVSAWHAPKDLHFVPGCTRTGYASKPREIQTRIRQKDGRNVLTGPTVRVTIMTRDISRHIIVAR